MSSYYLMKKKVKDYFTKAQSVEISLERAIYCN